MFLQKLLIKYMLFFRNLIKEVILFLIIFYQKFISSFLNMGGACRFYPSCSRYAYLAYKNKDFFSATKTTVLRLLSCHPFSSSFGTRLEEDWLHKINSREDYGKE